MKKYIKENFEPITVGLCVGLFIAMTYNFIDDLVCKILLILVK